MDWIRRNWPDLLIGIALVAVIAGIIATLLTGGSFFPLGQSGEEGTSRSTVSTGVRSGESTGRSDGATGSATPGGVAVEPRDATGQSAGGEDRTATGTDSVAAPDDTASGRARPVEVTALPLPGTPVANNIPATTSESGAATSQESRPAENPRDETRTQTSTQAERPATQAAADGAYRISVGAFSTDENAQRQAQRFRAAGYPVFIGTQGSLSIVLVGPYDRLDEAEQVADRIRAGDFGIEPVIYRFQAGEEEAGTPARSGTGTPAADPGPAAATPDPRPSASEASGARYLQVGAYATSASAQPLRQRLEGMGFRVSERVEGDLVKLLVGPFGGSELTDARALLSENGIDHFPR